jgi:hypothetical protein
VFTAYLIIINLRSLRAPLKNNIMKPQIESLYGVAVTPIEEMQFSIYRNNNPQIPAFNTISAEERTRIVREWVEKRRKELTSKQR